MPGRRVLTDGNPTDGHAVQLNCLQGDMAETEMNAFLTHLAVEGRVSASTQNQALSALLFLYRHVIGREIGDLGQVVRARRPKRLPVVLSRPEVQAVLDQLGGEKWLMASLLEAGHDIRTVQELLGHKDVKTTMVYTHVLNQVPMGVVSPMDQLKRGI